MTKLKNLVLVLAVLVPSVAKAGSLDDALLKAISGSRESQMVVGSSTTLMNVRYLGTQASAVASLLNLVWTFQAPSGTNDANIGNNGVFDLSKSTVNTLGEICDAINRVSTYSCKLLAGKRNDDVNLLRNAQGNDDLTGGGADMGLSTHAFQGIGITPAPGKFVRLLKCSWLSNAGVPLGVFGKPSRLSKDDGRSYDDTFAAFTAPNFPEKLMQTNFVEVSPSTTGVASTTNILPVALDDGAMDFAIGEHVVVRNSTMAAVPLTQITALTSPSTVGRLACSWQER